jgi:hypothetical protein
MSKYVIFVAGVAFGAAVAAIIMRKGSENMGQAVLLEEPMVQNQIGRLTLEQKKACPLRGLTSGSGLTVDKFLAMTRKDKELEQ